MKATPLRQGIYALLALELLALGAVAGLYYGSTLRLHQWPVVPAIVHVVDPARRLA